MASARGALIEHSSGVIPKEGRNSLSREEPTQERRPWMGAAKDACERDGGVDELK